MPNTSRKRKYIGYDDSINLNSLENNKSNNKTFC